MSILTADLLCAEAQRFSDEESHHPEPSLFGVTDGKAVGTYTEQKFRGYLRLLDFEFEDGNSASGIDFPGLGIDVKVTSIKQPQSSCPFKSARQKVYGLGYALIVFVYDKKDEPKTKTATLRMLETIFVEAHRTADFQTTKGLQEILDRQGNIDDLVAFMSDRNLPADEIELNRLATEILKQRPEQGRRWCARHI